MNYNQLPSKLYNYTQLPIETATRAVEDGAGATVGLDATELSPLNGNSSIKCVCPASQLNRFSLDWDTETQTIYPNTCILIKIVTGGTGKLADDICYPSIYFGEDTDHYLASIIFGQTVGNLSDTGEWQLFPINRDKLDVTDGGSLADWATTENNQGFDLTRMRFMFNGQDQPVTFYIGGVVTLNAPKAKLIMTWDSPHQSVIDEILPRATARGWKMVNAVPTSLFDTAPDIANIQKLYDAGWDIVNHSDTHTNPDTFTNAEFLGDYGRAKQMLRSNGWVRGNDFACYANRQIGGTLTKTAGDYLERILTMGRGKAMRSIYGSSGVKVPLDSYNPQVPFDLINLSDFYSTTDGGAGNQNDDYDADAVGPGLNMKSILAKTVLHKGVLVPFGHRIVNPPSGAEEASTVWLDAFFADIAQYEAAGLLEVVTMTDWHNELNGTAPYDPRFNNPQYGYGNNLQYGERNSQYGD
jgi:hypothetical protein